MRVPGSGDRKIGCEFSNTYTAYSMVHIYIYAERERERVFVVWGGCVGADICICMQ